MATNVFHPKHPAESFPHTEIDIVVNEGGEYSFYEIKTYPLLRACIREAIDNLLNIISGLNLQGIG